MLPLNPLGQHQFLARRPLGQSLSLGVLPPLGVSRAVIAQTFPVLQLSLEQLSLEQSARSPQTDRVWDGFIVSPSDSDFTSSSERSRPDQPSTASPTSPVPILQSPTGERTTPQEGTFPENLSLLSRKPLTAPKPLGGLLPLEQLSEQSSPIVPQQESLPNALQASFSNSEASEPESPATERLDSSTTQVIQPSVELELGSTAIAPEPTDVTGLPVPQADSVTPLALSEVAQTEPTDVVDSPVSQADSVTPLALSEVAQTIPMQRQPDVPSAQASQQVTEPSATSTTDRLSESDGLSESNRSSERAETQPSLNQIAEIQPNDTLQPSIAAETLEAESSEAATINVSESEDVPESEDVSESSASKATAIDAQPQLRDAPIVDPSIADPSNSSLQRSVDRPLTAPTASSLEADIVPSVSANTQQVGNAEEPIDLLEASQTLQPKITEPESTTQAEPTAIAPSDDIATQPPIEQTTATPINAHLRPETTLQQQPAIAPSSNVEPASAANLPIQDDRSDTTALSSSTQPLTEQTTATPINAHLRPETTLQRQSAIAPSSNVEPLSGATLPIQDDRSDITAPSISGTDNSTSELTSVEATRPQTESPALEKHQSVTESLVQPALDRKSSETGSPASMEVLAAEPTSDGSTVTPIVIDRSETFGDRPTEGSIQAAVPNEVSSLIEPSSTNAQDSLQKREDATVEQRSSMEVSTSESSREQASAMQPDSVHPPGLVNAAPLASPKSLITPSLPLAASLMESTLDDTTTSESTTPSTNQPIASPENTTIAHKTIVRKPSASPEPTAPTVSPSGATPDAWSSLSDLLNQSTSNQPEARSWQDVVADLSDTSPTPNVQRLEFEEAGAIDTMAGDPSESITLLNGSASEHLAAKSTSEAPTTAQGQPEALSDEQLDQLALSVYSRLRMQLEIDRERHGMFTTGYQLYLETVIPAVNFASDQTKATQKSQQQPDADDKLSPLNAKLEQLMGEVHYLLRSQIEIAQERYGFLASRYR